MRLKAEDAHKIANDNSVVIQEKLEEIYRLIEQTAKEGRFKLSYMSDVDDVNLIAPIKEELQPNPLYKRGASRVGCFPCIMSRKGEIKVLSKDTDMTERLIQLEKEVDSLGQKSHAGFFPKGYIPERFCKEYGDGCPTVQEVINYVNRNDTMIDMFEPEGGYSCMSLYHGLCE